jgi:hypothetical protein
MKTLDELNKEWESLKVKTDEYVKTVDLYCEAAQHAMRMMKYGDSVDPSHMSPLELISWYKESTCTG